MDVLTASIPLATAISVRSEAIGFEVIRALARVAHRQRAALINSSRLLDDFDDIYLDFRMPGVLGLGRCMRRSGGSNFDSEQPAATAPICLNR